jgi:hypothetical protein
MTSRMLLRNLLDADPETALGWSHPHDVVHQVVAPSTVIQNDAD